MALSQYDSPPLLEDKESIREYLLKLHNDVYGLGDDTSGSLSFTDNLIDPPDITGTSNQTFTIDTDDTGGNLSLVFGTTNNERLTWDDSASRFAITDCLKINSDLLLCPGSITSDSGSISFGDENLSTTGTLLSGQHTLSGNIVMDDNSLTGVDTITFTDVNGTIAGIENQNLLDKTATETITGSPWIFQNAVDSDDSLQVLDSVGSSALNINTNNRRVSSNGRDVLSYALMAGI